MALTIPLAANIDAVDAPAGAGTATLNVDFRQQPASGGFFSVEIAQSLLAGGTATVPATIDTVDSQLGAPTAVVDVDLRFAPGSGGFFNAEIAAALDVGIAPPTTPSTTTVAGGALGGETDFVKTTYTGPFGETTASPETSQVVAANNLLKVISPGAETGATGYNVYSSHATGTETLQNATPIAIGTAWTEPTSGLISTGGAPPASETLVPGSCSLVIAQGGAFAPGACTVTIKQ